MSDFDNENVPPIVRWLTGDPAATCDEATLRAEVCDLMDTFQLAMTLIALKTREFEAHAEKQRDTHEFSDYLRGTLQGEAYAFERAAMLLGHVYNQLQIKALGGFDAEVDPG